VRADNRQVVNGIRYSAIETYIKIGFYSPAEIILSHWGHTCQQQDLLPVAHACRESVTQSRAVWSVVDSDYTASGQNPLLWNNTRMVTRLLCTEKVIVRLTQLQKKTKCLSATQAESVQVKGAIELHRKYCRFSRR
jgi:hypothetical protein